MGCPSTSLPSNRLEFWFRLESDRLLNPVFREFYKERDVVQEERRLRRQGQRRTGVRSGSPSSRHRGSNQEEVRGEAPWTVFRGAPQEA